MTVRRDTSADALEEMVRAQRSSADADRIGKALATAHRLLERLAKYRLSYRDRQELQTVQSMLAAAIALEAASRAGGSEPGVPPAPAQSTSPG